jgi:hypothetical protein
VPPACSSFIPEFTLACKVWAELLSHCARNPLFLFTLFFQERSIEVVNREEKKQEKRVNTAHIRHGNMSNEDTSEPDKRLRNLIVKYHNLGSLHHATTYTKLSTIDLGNTSRLNKLDRLITETVFNNNPIGSNGSQLIDYQHELNVEKEILVIQRQINALKKQLKIKSDASIDNSLEIKDRIEIALDQACHRLCKSSQPNTISNDDNNAQYHTPTTLLLRAQIRALQRTIKGKDKELFLPPDPTVLPLLIQRLQTQIATLSLLRDNLLDQIQAQEMAIKFDERLIKELDQIYTLAQARRKKYRSLDQSVFHSRSSSTQEIFDWIKAEINERSELSEQESRQLMRGLKLVVKEHIGPYVFENIGKFPPIPLVDTSSSAVGAMGVNKRLKPLAPFNPTTRLTRTVEPGSGIQTEKEVIKSLLQLLLALLNNLISNDDNDFIKIDQDNELAARLLLATEVAVKDGTRPRLRLRPFSD